MRQTVFATYFMIMVALLGNNRNRNIALLRAGTFYAVWSIALFRPLGMDIYGWYQVARKRETMNPGVGKCNSHAMAILNGYKFN